MYTNIKYIMLLDMWPGVCHDGRGLVAPGTAVIQYTPRQYDHFTIQCLNFERLNISKFGDCTCSKIRDSTDCNLVLIPYICLSELTSIYKKDFVRCRILILYLKFEEGY